MPFISKRTSELGTEQAFVVLKEVNELKAKGVNIANFCIGQPDFDTPENVKQAAIKAINGGKSGYTPSPGIPELRKAVAYRVGQTHGMHIEPDWITIANGVREFIAYSILAATDYGKGDEVIYPNPGYPLYESQINVHGAKGVEVKLLEKNNFSFDIQEVEDKISKKTRLLVLNSPHNPTGGVVPAKDVKKIADLALEHDFFVLSDEAYARITYGEKFASIFALPDMQEHAILIDGVSKTYAMTGWRVGWAINKKLAERFGRWVTNIEACAGHPNQFAAVEALMGPQEEAEKMRKIYEERRNLIVDGLNKIPGFKCKLPGGAFYAFPNVTEACKMVRAKDSEEFRKMLLNEAKVAVVADIHFGHRNEEDGQHIRFSYATSSENIKEGLKRVNEFMEKKAKR